MKPLHVQSLVQKSWQMFPKFAILFVAFLVWCSLASAQHWTPLPTFPGNGAGTAILLTDGTVLVEDVSGPAQNGGTATGDWYILHPDNFGSYASGSWVGPIATSGFGYAPLYFGSAVLPDSRVVVVGGEYNFGSQDYTTLGTVYNLSSGFTTILSPPPGWTAIGDAPTVILPNGRLMLGSCCSKQEAILNPSTLTWTSTGSGKADANSEEGWTLLPNGKVLTVDTQNGNETELYNPTTGTWSLAGNTVFGLTNNCGMKIVPEMGPLVLRPNGTVFAAGASGYTGIYNYKTGTWSNGPIFPPNSGNGHQNAVADGPAAILPDGNVLVQASPLGPCFVSPSDYFEFNGKSLIRVPGPPNASNEASMDGRMLVLPNGGHVLHTDGTTDVEVYIPVGLPKSSWAPTITSFPTTITEGGTYTIRGTQFNGLSQGAAYGDDAQSATNFPLVRLSINGFTYYLPTKHFNTSVATGTKPTQAAFTLSFFVGTGPATAVVVANGIASAPVSLTVK